MEKTKSILLVDDDPDILELMRDILECEDYQVITAEDGLLGSLKVKNQDFDLVISDLNMPKQDGIKFLNNIIKDKMASKKSIPPIIIMTGEVTPLAKEICQKGNIPLLEKPFSSDRLLEEVLNCLTHKQKKKNVADNNATIPFNKGEIIIKKGVIPSYLYLIKTGVVAIKADNQEPVEILSTGEILGTASIISKTPFPLDAIALEDTTLSKIPIDKIMKVLKEQPKWMSAIIVKLARENIKLQNR